MKNRPAKRLIYIGIFTDSRDTQKDSIGPQTYRKRLRARWRRFSTQVKGIATSKASSRMRNENLFELISQLSILVFLKKLQKTPAFLFLECFG